MNLRLKLFGRNERNLALVYFRRTVFRFAREGDVAAFSWVDGGMSYVVTGRTDEARLLTVAQAVDAQVRGLVPAPRQP